VFPLQRELRFACAKAALYCVRGKEQIVLPRVLPIRLSCLPFHSALVPPAKHYHSPVDRMGTAEKNKGPPDQCTAISFPKLRVQLLRHHEPLLLASCAGRICSRLESLQFFYSTSLSRTICADVTPLAAGGSDLTLWRIQGEYNA
jgi:hypothetical protein